MDESRSKKLALEFLAAVSGGEVDRIVQSDAALRDDGNWHPYGRQSKNWDRVGVQTSEPVGALAELLINSIDAILMRKAKEHGLEPRGEGAPKSMIEAVRRFFPGVPEGRIARLEPGALERLAGQSILVGVKRVTKKHKYPTYTIADFGEGQNPADFPNTLLSLGEKNKEGIPFVQGRFNMGSTGSIVFCTQGDIRQRHYKLILSKRTLPDSDKNWGWALIRTRDPKGGEDLPVVEYFAPGGVVSKFRMDNIQAFQHKSIGVIDGGTIVKLYEYDIGPSVRAVDLGLDQGLTTNLLECALPIEIYDFDAEPRFKGGKFRPEGISNRTFSGMKIAFSEAENIDLPFYSVLESTENSSLGKIHIFATGIKKLPKHMDKNPFRCFYTVNGQAQAKDRASMLHKAKLDDLRDHIIVQVDCNEMKKTARAGIFKPDRERMNDKEISRELKDLVVDALRNDRALREYAKTIRQRRVTETIQNSEQSKGLWNLLVHNNPELRDLLGMGEVIRGDSDGGMGLNKFEGEQFPTKLILWKPGDGVLSVPINTYRIVECETDAANDYLGRNLDPGRFILESESEIPYSRSLRNGKLRVRIWVPSDAAIGDSVDATFGFKDSSRPEPLTQTIKIVCAPEEPTTTTPPGKIGNTGRGQSSVHGAPNIRWVEKSHWSDHRFDEESGARCVIGDEGVDIFVNKNNKHLESLLKNEREDSDRELATDLFGWGVGVLTLSMHKKFSDNPDKFQGPETDWEECVQYASAAISAHVVTLIRKLGGQRR